MDKQQTVAAPVQTYSVDMPAASQIATGKTSVLIKNDLVDVGGLVYLVGCPTFRHGAVWCSKRPESIAGNESTVFRVVHRYDGGRAEVVKVETDGQSNQDSDSGSDSAIAERVSGVGGESEESSIV